jgi:hypothetical protein
VERHFLCSQQSIDETLVLLTRQRAIDIVGTIAGGACLFIAGLEPGDVEIDRVTVNDGCDGVEEGERIMAGRTPNRVTQCRRSERPCGNDGRVPFRGGQANNLLPANLNQRMTFEGRGDISRKSVTIDRKRRAGGKAVFIGCTHYQ